MSRVHGWRPVPRHRCSTACATSRPAAAAPTERGARMAGSPGRAPQRGSAIWIGGRLFEELEDPVHPVPFKHLALEHCACFRGMHLLDVDELAFALQLAGDG